MLSKEKFSKSYQNANVLNLVYKEKKSTLIKQQNPCISVKIGEKYLGNK